jgi:DNA-binding FrmR family transcriptional regulator
MQKNIMHRVRRASGQLEAVERLLAVGAPCDEVIPQLLAVRGAIHGVCTAYLARALTECDRRDRAKLESLLASLLHV